MVPMYTLVSAIARTLKKILPAWLVRPLLPAYHQTLSIFSALVYGFPAKRMTVIGVTGTKGKSTVCEMLFQIFKDAGHKTALASTIRFAVGDESEPNRFKMTMQGRGFLQRFLSAAQKQGATHAIVEITSEGVLEGRHRFLSLDGLIVTNIQKEHIERHGSFEAYVAAKRKIVAELEHSKKTNTVLVANADNAYTRTFLNEASVSDSVPFSESELPSFDIHLPVPGVFNRMNALAAIKMTESFGIAKEAASAALARMPPVKGRVESIDAGQPFRVIVDYAHTPDSLEALYGAFPRKNEAERKICVLGNTGGGRDTWKRPLMGAIADRECDVVILTDEDPYDEDPRTIINDMTSGMKRPPLIELDRRKAIALALYHARPGDVVLVSGKGTDPYIMKSRGEKIPWSDAAVVREELARVLEKEV